MTNFSAGDRVHGDAGVFYTDHDANGVVLNMVGDGYCHVQLDDGDRAVVPADSLTLEG